MRNSVKRNDVVRPALYHVVQSMDTFADAKREGIGARVNFRPAKLVTD